MIRTAMRTAIVAGLSVALVGPLGGAASASELVPRVSAPVRSSHEFDNPSSLAASGDSLWVSNDGNDNLVELNGVTCRVLRTIPGDGGALAVHGSDLWSLGGSSLIELNASTGARIRVVRGAKYGFNEVDGLAFYGPSMWVSNAGNNSLTEMNVKTGALIRVIRSAHLDNPGALAVDASNLWVANTIGSPPLVEFDAATGTYIRDVPGGAYESPGSLQVVGNVLWAANIDSNTLWAVNASTGSRIRVIESAADMFAEPGPFALIGPRLWVADFGDESLTELRANNGSLIRVVHRSSDHFNEPADLALVGSRLWVANSGGYSLTEVNAVTGATIRTVG